MSVFIGGIRGFEAPTITQAQYAKLKKIEDSALKYYQTLKGGYYDSRRLSNDYYWKWEETASKLGILGAYGDTAKFKVQGMGEKGDFSYGYQFHDLFPY